MPPPPRTAFSVRMVTPNVLNLESKSHEAGITDIHADLSPTHAMTALRYFSCRYLPGFHMHDTPVIPSLYPSRNLPIHPNSLSIRKATMLPSALGLYLRCIFLSVSRQGINTYRLPLYLPDRCTPAQLLYPLQPCALPASALYGKQCIVPPRPSPQPLPIIAAGAHIMNNSHFCPTSNTFIIPSSSRIHHLAASPLA